MKVYLSVLTLLLFISCNRINRVEITSPDKKIEVQIVKDDLNDIRYQISFDGTVIVEPSLLGVKTREVDFKNDLKIVAVSDVSMISDEYETLTEKRRNNKFQANEREVTLKDKDGNQLGVQFRVSNDGVAFRYHFFNTHDTIIVLSEYTSFKVPEISKAWLHPHANVKDGWCRTQPSYEENYFIDIAVGAKAPVEAGWSFPALFKVGEKWMLISESGLEPPYCGSRLAQNAPKGEYTISFPQQGETIDSTDLITPVSTKEFYSPWRAIIMGSLASIVESNMITALAPPAAISDSFIVEPGISSWSWGVLKDESVNFNTQKEFIDMASELGWKYCLVDADWDRRIGYEKIQQLAKYASDKKVGLILWYNSSGDWNTTVYSPKSALTDSTKRLLEFDRIRKIGIKGIKVDFWPGDGPSAIKYYYDIMRDASKYGLMVNFHGATIPRGWTRTFPNLASMEAVRGFEFTTFAQENNDKNPVHCTILPFTRNAIGPMDYTPVCLGEIPGIVRRTSSAFELALSIVFQSGIQHIVETPASLKNQPDFVVDFLKSLPPSWDDVKLVDGFPGKYVVIARKYKNNWYVAGINAQNDTLKLNVDLSPFQPGEAIRWITDGNNNRSFKEEAVGLQNGIMNIEIAANGGFVLII
jgi:alpha-glucosidase